MKKKIFVVITIALALILLVTVSAMAMTSPNYVLNWFVQLSGGGGGHAVSPSYSVNYTIGQVAAGSSSSTNYRVGLGYWQGAGNSFSIYVPAISR